MNKISEIIGKPVIALSSAELVGTVSSILFDERLSSAKAFRLVCEDDSEPEYGFIAWHKVLYFNADACVIADRSAVLFEWNAPAGIHISPIGCDVYGRSGKYYGRVTEVVLDGGRTVEILAGERSIAPQEVLTSSQKIILLNEPGDHKKLPRKRKPTMPKKPQGEVAVKIHAAPGKPAVSDPVPVPTRVPPQNTLVSRTPQSPPVFDAAAYAFLLGKILSRDLKSDDDKLLAAKGSAVSEEVIRLAKQAGKLVQLALYAD